MYFFLLFFIFYKKIGVGKQKMNNIKDKKPRRKWLVVDIKRPHSEE